MRTCSLLLLALALQDDFARRDPWSGFGEGSWVILARKVKDGDKVQETREKHLLLAPRDGGAVRQVQKERDGAFVADGSETSHAPGAPLEGAEWGEAKTRSEEIQVDGKTFACTVSEHAVEKGEARGKLAVWRSAAAKIPYREIVRDGPDMALMPDILRVEVSIERGARKDSHAVRVVALAEKLRVGARDVACAVEEWTSEETRGGNTKKASFKRWLSDEVPGRVVKMEGKLVSAGKSVEMTLEASDFAVKP